MYHFKHKIITACFVVFSLGSFNAILAQNLYLNEILASNISYYAGNAACVDLIEIYNNSSNSIDLGGYFLTDNKSSVYKWEIPTGTSIAANGYLVFYADGLNTSVHTNFKLNVEGGFIGIYDNVGAVADSFTYTSQYHDRSFGRSGSNLNTMGYFQTPTPGTANGAISYTAIVQKPVFSIQGGFYAVPQTLAITAQAGATIRYTTNGAEPTASSTLYTGTIAIDSTMCIRATAYVSGMLTNYPVTQTYFVNVVKDLPVISIVTDPNNFFSNTTGIYVIGTNGITAGCSSTPMNLNQDWERPVNIELYDVSGKICLNQGAGVKIFGGCSRQRFPIKSLEVFARKEYGKGSFDYKIFGSENNLSFESFLIRSSSDDQQYTMFRDGLGHTLAAGLKAETQAYQPAVVYINGQYWGIQNLREKYNEAYFEEHFGVTSDNLNVVENNSADSYNVKIGSATSYNNMLTYLRAHATNSNIYEYMNSQMDIESYIDYMASQIYLGADDWPGNNIRYWKANTGRYNRWRWVFYDMDQVVMLNNSRWNSILLATTPYGGGWPNPSWSVELFNNMLKGNKFKYEFLERIMFLMNTTYSTENIVHVIDSLQNKIIDEMPSHIDRWGGQLVSDPQRASWILPLPDSMQEWEYRVQIMRDFATDRPDTNINMLQRFFNLSDTVRITLNSNDSESGYLYMGPKMIPGDTHSGVYFSEIPLEVNAKPKPGYRFVRWEVTPEGSSTEQFDTCLISYIPETNTGFRAVFEPYDIEGPTLVINEINYKSVYNQQAGDWVEFYNRVGDPADISGWILKDEKYKHNFEIPENIVIPPYGYYVLCEDSTLFDQQFPDVSNRKGDFEFGLGDGEDIVSLYDQGMTFIDSVHYYDSSPWPIMANGFGSTLALISPEIDNDLAGSWSDLYEITPGDTNILKVVPPVSITELTNSGDSWLLQNYPNPCEGSTTIGFGLNTSHYVTIVINDISGRMVKTIYNNKLASGSYTVQLDLSGWTPGIYFYSLRVDNKLVQSLMMIVK